ncbi:hypothetical protein QFW77_17435 [Luteimonas sp. RD2P54]|uniref:Uncharacterized protein n=1 Tax=Luteimonas endophytica TaxID=3042023 RepID=A0ABT6JD57_9GAMM|nr:hypothetical protein [Luteimonas endophytica]MDH5824755.1 hypothetical protein [Luteimonas endophytica]
MASSDNSTTVEGDGARLEADFAYDPRQQALRVRYRLHNTGDAALAVFDRGNRHAVLTGRQQPGAVSDPVFREDGADVTLSHIALPLPSPSPTVPPTPLAVRLPAGAELEGEFTFAPPTAEPARRMRWCLGVADFEESEFTAPEDVGGVEVWQASFAHVERQQLLCTPWFDVAAGTFEAER